MLVSLALPCGDLGNERRFVGDSTVEALRRQHGEFGFRHIKPTSVLGRIMPLEALGEPPRLGSGKRGVERRWGVRGEVVLDQHNLHRVGEVCIRQLFEHMGVVGGGVAVGHFDAAPAFEWRDHHEQTGHTVAMVFVIVTRLAPRRGWHGSSRFRNQRLRRFVHANHGTLRVMRPLIDLQHVFHIGDEGRVGLRRDPPWLLEMRLENVFLSVRPIVLSLAFATMFNSTTFCSSRLSVHRA